MTVEHNPKSKQLLEDIEEFHGELPKQGNTLLELKGKVVPSTNRHTNPTKQDIENFKYARTFTSFTLFVLNYWEYAPSHDDDWLNDFFSNDFKLYRETTNLKKSNYYDRASNKNIDFTKLHLEDLFILANEKTLFDFNNFVHFLTKKVNRIEKLGTNSLREIENFTLDPSDKDKNVNMTELEKKIQELENRLNIDEIIKEKENTIKSRIDLERNRKIEEIKEELKVIKENVEVIKRLITPYIKAAEIIGKNTTSSDSNEPHYEMEGNLKLCDVSLILKGDNKSEIIKPPQEHLVSAMPTTRIEGDSSPSHSEPTKNFEQNTGGEDKKDEDQNKSKATKPSDLGKKTVFQPIPPVPAPATPDQSPVPVDIKPIQDTINESLKKFFPNKLLGFFQIKPYKKYAVTVREDNLLATRNSLLQEKQHSPNNLFIQELTKLISKLPPSQERQNSDTIKAVAEMKNNICQRLNKFLGLNSCLPRFFQILPYRTSAEKLKESIKNKTTFQELKDAINGTLDTHKGNNNIKTLHADNPYMKELNDLIKSIDDKQADLNPQQVPIVSKQ